MLGWSNRPLQGMVSVLEIHQDPGDNSLDLCLRPNPPATPKQNNFLIFLVVTGLVIVAGGWALQGFWPILPFAGLELWLLLFVTRHVIRASRFEQRLKLDDSTVRLTEFSDEEKVVFDYPRPWVKLVKIDQRGMPARVFLRSHGKQRELGAFLGAEEKSDLIRTLEHSIRNYVAGSRPP